MIGRKNEITILDKLYNSNKAQFVAVYGRRRVGKTYLINEVFDGKITFRHAGLSPIESDSDKSDSPLRKQHKHFYNSLILQGMKKSKCPDNWMDAFLMLEMHLQSIKYVPFGCSKREEYYKLTDPFCNFYLRFIEGSDSLCNDFWLSNILSQNVITWRGIAFENVC